jgi:PAS domain S-box-containing protein
MKSEENTALARVLAALDAAGDVAYVWDLASDALEWHGSPRLLGLTEPEAVANGRGFAERINPDDTLVRQQRLQAHYARGTAFDIEYRIRLADGSSAWLHERGTAEFDDMGRPNLMRGVLRAVTQRKSKEQKLEHLANYDELTGHFNRKRLREALEQVLAQVARADMRGAYLAVGIDKLASINDVFGYEAADQVIIDIGQRLDRCLRVSDVIGRIEIGRAHV